MKGTLLGEEIEGRPCQVLRATVEILIFLHVQGEPRRLLIRLLRHGEQNGWGKMQGAVFQAGVAAGQGGRCPQEE